MPRGRHVQPYNIVRNTETKQYAVVPVFTLDEESDLSDRVNALNEGRRPFVDVSGVRENRERVEALLLRDGFERVAHVDLILGVPTYTRRRS